MAANPVTHLTLLTPGGPQAFPALTGADGSIRTADSFGDYGVDESAVGSAFDPLALYNSRRSLALDFRASYFACTQHDGKAFDWNGCLRGDAQTMRNTPPMLGSAAASQYVPLNQRRPSAPVRLGRKVVFSFTGMLFGQGRWPQMRSKDPETQAAAEQLCTSADVALTFVEARNMGGPSGAAGVSWKFVEGLPRTMAHRGRNLHVLFWADRDRAIPAHVVELKQIEQLAADPDDEGKLKPMAFWQRRDWTLKADVVFKLVPVFSEGPLQWEIDEEASFIHNDDECHLVWIKNLPSEDDSEDGTCDYAETYEQQDELDILNTVSVHGVKLNLDPTLVLSLAEEQSAPGVVKKGSDNALILMKGGTAQYLQLADSAVGREQVNLQRQQILEACECVVLDPDKAAAAAASGEAQRLVYSPMLNKTDILRMQWGPAIALVLNQMLRSWRRLRSTPVEVPVANDLEPDQDQSLEPAADEEPVYEEVPQDLCLPPRVLRKPADDGSGEQETELPHDPGTGEVTVEWGPYFKPSGSDKQTVLGGLGTATGGKPVLSQRAGVELAANLLDRDATEEWEAVQAEAAAARDAMSNEFSGTPGLDDSAPAAGPAGTSFEIAPTDGTSVLKVDEVRKIIGQGPLTLADGSPDPDGQMSFIAYKAKVEAQQAVEGEAEGVENTDDGIDLPVPAPRLLPTMDSPDE